MKYKKTFPLALVCAVLSFTLFAQNAKTSPENNAAQRLESMRKDPQLLRGFLLAMPKGGDLHNHLSGAAYAEDYIQWGADMGLCVDTQTFSYIAPYSASAAVGETPCVDAKTQRPAKDALSDPILHRNLIAAFSMRNWPAELNGEDHFFDTFGKFGAVSGRSFGKMLVEVTHRAAYQNEHYLELMTGLDDGVAYEAAATAGSIPGNDFAGYRDRLMVRGLDRAAARGKKLIDDAEAEMKRLQKCGKPEADIGCSVTIRYVYQVLRAMPRERVFAQTLAGFLMARGGTQADPRVVALNFVQPEDAYIPMHDFDDHMNMLDWLHQQYPQVNVTLHAGELAFGQVMPTDLGQHIRKSIEKGHAKRIGHGVDVMYDPDAAGLLKKMAAEKIAVEINLTSNDAILGVRGKQHPLPHYLKAGVPVVLCTDDEGVSRSDITHEYQRAVEEFGLSYAQMKRISRNALEFSFLSGKSLWDGNMGKVVSACAEVKSAACEKYVEGNDKAKAQRELELKFGEFEK